MKQTSPVFLACSLTFLIQLILFCPDSIAKDQLNEILFITANNMNKQLPMMGSNEMEFTSVLAIRHDFIFRYRFVNRTKAQINLKQEKFNLYTTTKSGVCSTPETVEFLRQGVGEKFMYYDRNNTYLFDFYINKDDCN